MRWLAAALALMGIGSAHAAIQALPAPKSCTGTGNMRFSFNVVDPKWSVMKLAGGLKQPRTIIWDSQGHMLVLQATKGISVHTFGADGCINSTTMLVSNIGLNHGLQLTPDSKTLYASSETTVWKWAYDPATMKVSSQAVVVRGIASGIHSTRTLLVVPSQPNMVLVQCGSNANLDMQAAQASTGRAIVKIFDMDKAPSGGYNYNTEGEVFGYGLRNEIGLTADPNGMVWGVENSGDDFRRTINGASTDIHKDNPAEKLNFLGDPLKDRNVWYGYPTCFGVWDPSPFSGSLKTGQQFVLSPNSSFSDANCATKATPPRLSFQAHSAPIAAAFDSNATNLYVTFHGSWDRQPATGFKLVQVPFTKLANGQYDPVAKSDSMKGYTDIFGAPNEGSSCTANGLTQSNCFRLSASAWDPAGRGLFISSDNSAEGEIYLVSQK